MKLRRTPDVINPKEPRKGHSPKLNAIRGERTIFTILEQLESALYAEGQGARTLQKKAEREISRFCQKIGYPRL